MSEGAPPFDGPPEKQTTQQVPGDAVQLVITYYRDTGRIDVFGPIDDQLLSFGLLQVAQRQIELHHERKQAQRAAGGGLIAPPAGFRLPRS
jgi:hypothetical protein